jgi:hypothetical protein
MFREYRNLRVICIARMASSVKFVSEAWSHRIRRMQVAFSLQGDLIRAGKMGEGKMVCHFKIVLCDCCQLET